MDTLPKSDVADQKLQKSKLTWRGYVALAFVAWLLVLFIWSAINPSQTIFSSQGWNITNIIATLVFGLPILAGLVSIPIICALKGKQGLALIGLLGVPLGGSLWALIGALRLAKPNSWWARRYYGHKEMAIAMQRFGSK